MKRCVIKHFSIAQVYVAVRVHHLLQWDHQQYGEEELAMCNKQQQLVINGSGV